MTFRFRAFSWNAVEATGPDTTDWLGGIVTCDLPAASSDGARWGLLLSKQGKILAELLLTRSAQAAISVIVRGGDAEVVRSVLEHHLVMEDVELDVVRPATFGIVLGSSAEDLQALAAADVELCSVPAPFGSPAALLVRSSASVAELTTVLARRGTELLDREWDDARVSMGLPTFGIDFDESDNPHQASLERRAISWQKGCYLGQEVVFMQDARGKVKRRLVRLTGVGGAAVQRGDRVTTDAGEEIGQVTTAGASQVLAKLSAPHFEPGASVRLGKEPVTVEALDAGLFGRTGPPGRVQK